MESKVEMNERLQKERAAQPVEQEPLEPESGE